MKKYMHSSIYKNGLISPAIRLVAAVFILFFTVIYVLPQIAKISPEIDTALSGMSSKNVLAESQVQSSSSQTTAVFEEQYEQTDNIDDNSTGFVTPSDILQMQQEYITTFSEITASGVVSEENISTKGATDIIGNVSVRNCTAEQNPDFAALLEEGILLENIDEKNPLVLIFHTHTTESYLCVDDGVFYSDFSTRTDDNSKNMVRIGEEICSVLEKNGIGYIHDTKVYDESYNGAYSRSRVTVLEYLEQYPSIQIVLDVHRDAVYYSNTNRAKFVSVIDGKKAAQIMIITGAEEGLVTDFPNWEQNLAFALNLHNAVQTYYEGLMKPIYFCQRKYNMDVVPYSLLIEVGTDANTLEEAVYSAYLFGESLSRLIKENIVINED